MDAPGMNQGPLACHASAHPAELCVRQQGRQDSNPNAQALETRRPAAGSPLGVGVTGGTRTRAAGLTTPNAAHYTTVTVASAGVEPAWRRRMKPAEPQAPLAVDRIRPAGFEPAS